MTARRAEKATYVEYLGSYRLTLGGKCDGLTPEQLATRSVPPSTLSLLGLVRVGLALASAVATTHRGRLVLDDTPQGGLEACIELPEDFTRPV